MIKCIDTESFKIKLEQLRPNCFNVDKVIYKNRHHEVIITCLRCNLEFKIKPDILFGKKKECCPDCNLKLPKRKNVKCKFSLQDYIEYCTLRGWKPISTEIPKNTDTPGFMIECEYGHRWDTSSLHSLRKGHGCPECSNHKKITLNDYINVCKDIGEFIGELPKNSYSPAKWLCYNCNNLYYAVYAEVKRGSWRDCKNVRNLNNYIKICKNNGKFIDELPKNTKCLVNWLCFNCNSIYVSCYDRVRSGTWCNCKNKIAERLQWKSLRNRFTGACCFLGRLEQ